MTEISTLLEHISKKSKQIFPQLVEIRRQIHQQPELAWEEHRTGQIIQNRLNESGINGQTCAETGLLVELGPDKSNKAVALRIDMDALPVQEQTNLPFASQKPGVMHACGHDVHIAIGVGVIEVLHEIKEMLPGKIRIFFQPAKEFNSGGAQKIIQEGILEGVQQIYGFHVHPSLNVGQIGIKFGVMLSSSDTFTLEIKSKDEAVRHHHLSAINIITAAQIINALRQITSRRIDPLKPSQINVRTICGGQFNGELTDRVELKGDIFTVDKEMRGQLQEILQQTVTGFAQANDVDFELTFSPGPPILHNEYEPTHTVKIAAQELLGEKNVISLPYPEFAIEDFSYYLQKIPGSYFRLGCASNLDTSYPLHSPYFNVDESCMEVGVKILSRVVIESLYQA